MPMVDPDNTVLIGAGGAVGQLVHAALLARPCTLTAVDLVAPDAPVDRCRWLIADARQPSEDLATALANAGTIVLCLPESVSLAALATLAPLIRRGSLLVAVLSIHARFADAVLAQEPAFEALGMNPMFRPDLGFAGQRVMLIPITVGRRSAAWELTLQSWGAVPVTVDPVEHDRLSAAVQAVPHAVLMALGESLRRLGHSPADVLAIAPPPCRLLLALVARLVTGNAEVYRELQACNPEAQRTRQVLCEAVEELGATAAQRPAFDALWEQLQNWLGGEAPLLTEMATSACADISRAPGQMNVHEAAAARSTGPRSH
jgi:prephenate dehydrogenase